MIRVGDDFSLQDGTESRLLVDEQIALLGKMWIHSNEQLNSHEKEIYDHLVEYLSRKAARLKRLESRGRQVQTAPAQTAPDTTLLARYNFSPQQEAMAAAMRRARPEEIVRTFVECWDKEDFEREFLCLSDSFQKGNRAKVSIDEYAQDRRSKFQQRFNTKVQTKQVVEVGSAVIRANRAYVDCIELHRGKGIETTIYRQYELQNEELGWRVIDYTNKRETTTFSKM